MALALRSGRLPRPSYVWGGGLSDCTTGDPAVVDSDGGASVYLTGSLCITQSGPVYLYSSSRSQDAAGVRIVADVADAQVTL